MEQYTASNGVHISKQPPVTDRGAWLMVDGHMTSPNDAQALREFFRAEEDERLGRWRWPENPDYVVYAEQPGTDWVRVYSESQPLMVRMERQKACLEYVDRTVYQNAARAYFDAHPERKPWHDAKPGEAWAINIGDDNWQAVVVHNGGRFLYRDGGSVSTSAEHIEDGRRIWPEESA